MVAGLPCTPGGHSYHSCAAPELAVLLAGARAGRRRPSTVKVIGPPALESAPSKKRSIAAWVLTGGSEAYQLPTKRPCLFHYRPALGRAGRRGFPAGVRRCCGARGLLGRHLHGVQRLRLRRRAARRGLHMAPRGLSGGPLHCPGPVLEPPRVSSACPDGGLAYGPCNLKQLVPL